MKFIKKLLTENEYNSFSKEINFKLRGLTKNISISVKTENIDDLNISVEDYVKYNDIMYWLKIIEYEFEVIHESLIYIKYENEKIKNITLNNLDDLEDFPFFYDTLFSNFSSVFDRILQLLNLVWGLELNPNIISDRVVNKENIVKKLKEKRLFDVLTLFNSIDIKTRFIRRVRNAIIHHYHPLHNELYTLKYEPSTVLVEKEMITTNDYNRRKTINILTSSFNKLNNDFFLLLVEVSKEFTIRCFEKDECKEMRLVLNFEEDVSIG